MKKITLKLWRELENRSLEFSNCESNRLGFTKSNSEATWNFLSTTAQKSSGDTKCGTARNVRKAKPECQPQINPTTIATRFGAQILLIQNWILRRRCFVSINQDREILLLLTLSIVEHEIDHPELRSVSRSYQRYNSSLS